MVEKGVVASINEAFDQFLGTGKPAYVDKQRVECVRAIEIILDAGGVPVLAHPGLLDYKTENQIDELIGKLKKAGIQGVEGHTPDQTRLYAELAQRHDLLMTGGSDFHGAIQPEIEMGSGQGDLIVPYELFEKLIQH
jgi:predicted metal-dependent phosphoesterase TrpH